MQGELYRSHQAAGYQQRLIRQDLLRGPFSDHPVFLSQHNHALSDGFQDAQVVRGGDHRFPGLPLPVDKFEQQTTLHKSSPAEGSSSSQISGERPCTEARATRRLPVVPSGWRAVLISSTIPSKTFDIGKIAGKKIGSLPINHFKLRPGAIIRDPEEHQQGQGAEKSSQPLHSKLPVIRKGRGLA